MATSDKDSSDIFSYFLYFFKKTYIVVLIAVFISFAQLKDFKFDAVVYQVPNFENNLKLVSENRLNYNLDDDKFTRKIIHNYPGPECIVYNSDSFFTGLVDGRVMKIDYSFKKVEEFIRIKSNSTKEYCDGKVYRMRDCGRPLGLEIHSDNLYIVDAFDGLYSVDIKTKKIQYIPLQAYLAGVLDEELIKNALFNTIKFDPVNPYLIYLAVSTTKYSMDQLPYSIFEHENSGLLLAIDLKNKNGSVISKDLYFTNGIELSSDKEFLYVSQTTNYSISKLNLDRLRKNLYFNIGEMPKLETFIPVLPGEPDNLFTKNGNIYVGLSLIRIKGYSILDYLSNYAIVRNFICKSSIIVSKVINFVRSSLIERIFKTKIEFLENLEFQFYSGHIFYKFIKAKGGIVVYSEKTQEIVKVIASNEFGFISHAVVHPQTNEIVFGSFYNDFIGIIKDSKV